MKLNITRYLLLQKRMIRKKSFILMMLSVFVFVLILRGVSLQNSSMITIAIGLEENADDTAMNLYNDFEKNGVVLSYDKYESPEEAINAVATRNADEAWIIPANLSDIVSEFAATNKVSSPIQIYARESSVVQFLLRELLEARLFKYVSAEIYEQFSKENLGSVTADFSSYISADKIFRLYDMGDDEEEIQPSYIMAPLRGLISLWMMIAAIASAMYYINDRKNGLFIYWRTKSEFIREFFYLFVIIFDSSVIALISILLAGIFTLPILEIGIMLLYDVILTFFAMLIIRVMRSEIVIGIFTPVMITVAAVFSPVFMELRAFEVICRLVPPFHYIKNSADPYYMPGMIVYLCCIGGVVVILDYLLKIKVSNQSSGNITEK